MKKKTVEPNQTAPLEPAPLAMQKKITCKAIIKSLYSNFNKTSQFIFQN